jgi:hypothetical protein
MRRTPARCETGIDPLQAHNNPIERSHNSDEKRVDVLSDRTASAGGDSRSPRDRHSAHGGGRLFFLFRVPLPPLPARPSPPLLISSTRTHTPGEGGDAFISAPAISAAPAAPGTRPLPARVHSNVAAKEQTAGVGKGRTRSRRAAEHPRSLLCRILKWKKDAPPSFPNARTRAGVRRAGRSSFQSPSQRPIHPKGVEGERTDEATACQKLRKQRAPWSGQVRGGDE